MNSLRVTFPLSAKAAGSAGIIEGYASTFGGPPDAYGDIVQAGAFIATLAEHKANGTSPAMFWAHDQREPIGKWQSVREDSKGLFVRGKLTMTVQRARDAFALAKDGAMALSIGFSTVRQSVCGGANVLEAVRLGEVSLVGIAANPLAKITSVKSIPRLGTLREYELFLHKLGLSGRQAKRLATGGWFAFHEEKAELDELAQVIRASAHNFGVTK